MLLPFTREQAFTLLQNHNHEPFHIKHALTVEAVMRYFAMEKGYSDDSDYWATVGLMHDVDFEEYPDRHCQMAPALLSAISASDEFIHSVCSHGYGICSDVEPVHEMEKILFAVDELTGLIGAASLMRPSKSCTDMDLKSLKKKFKDKKFAAGCSRDIISVGAQRLGWELDTLLSETLAAMQQTEEEIERSYSAYCEP